MLTTNFIKCNLRFKCCIRIPYTRLSLINLAMWVGAGVGQSIPSYFFIACKPTFCGKKQRKTKIKYEICVCNCSCGSNLGKHKIVECCKHLRLCKKTSIPGWFLSLCLLVCCARKLLLSPTPHTGTGTGTQYNNSVWKITVVCRVNCSCFFGERGHQTQFCSLFVYSAWLRGVCWMCGKLSGCIFKFMWSDTVVFNCNLWLRKCVDFGGGKNISNIFHLLLLGYWILFIFHNFYDKRVESN